MVISSIKSNWPGDAPAVSPVFFLSRASKRRPGDVSVALSCVESYGSRMPVCVRNVPSVWENQSI